MKIKYSVTPIDIKVSFDGELIDVIFPEDLFIFNVTDNFKGKYTRNYGNYFISETKSICNLEFIVRTKDGKIHKYPWYMCKVYPQPLYRYDGKF